MASRFDRLVGPQAMHLRPGTTLEEMLQWAASTKVDSMDFALVFEPELRVTFAIFRVFRGFPSFVFRCGFVVP